MRPDGVEVAQQHDVPLGVGLLHVRQHLFQHRLSPAVGIGALSLVHVCFVIGEWLGNGFTHGFQSSKVDDGVNLVLREDLVHCLAVADVGLDHRHAVSDDFFHAAYGLGLRVVEVVNYDHAVACLV